MGTLVELLLSLILALTGIARDVDSSLTTIAEQRVVEIQTDFSHSQQRPGTWEVLAWNQGKADPVRHAMGQWQASPTHWAILTNGELTAVGCAIASNTAADQVTRWWFACVLSSPSTPSSPSNSPTLVANSPTLVAPPAVGGEGDSSDTPGGDEATTPLPDTAVDPPVPPGDAVPPPAE